MKDRLRFFLSRIRERLWVRPLAMCVLSVAVAFLAKAFDYLGLGANTPDVTIDSIESLLTILSASMLVIATFAVASMVSAYASASSTATPRSFPLVISDDVSQNALSTFIGAFIFSIISLIALQNSYYDRPGRFVLFVLTLAVFAIVILTFVRWMDQIARLGRLGATIDKAEAATATALRRRKLEPLLGGVPVGSRSDHSTAFYGTTIGYVQRIDIAGIQAFAEDRRARVEVVALPGAFAAPGRVLAYVLPDSAETSDVDLSPLEAAFEIGDDRTFDEDPRFGLIVLSEIASRALSPAVNDPGTAIDVIGTMVRLFTLWTSPNEEDPQPTEFDRVAVPELRLSDMFDDAFSALARDGASVREVMIRLQKAFESLASIDDVALRLAVKNHAALALARAEKALDFPADLEHVRLSARFIDKL